MDESKLKSYLYIAQPLTLKSLLRAKQNSDSDLTVDLFTIKHKSENIDPPKSFIQVKDIEKYACEYIPFLKDTVQKPLPRLTDIINGLYQASEAEFFVYTNLDISLMPSFYNYIKKLILQGHDAIYINRENLPKEYNGVRLDESNLDLCYKVSGTPHVGIDCFVFKRSIVTKLNLRNAFYWISTHWATTQNRN